jgi:hypothetical protein
MDKEDIVMIILLLLILGIIWGLPKGTLYNTLVTLVAALFAGGWFASKKRRRG